MGASEAPASTPRAPILPEPLLRPFRAIIFDWDGTAVRDRSEDARPLAAVVEPLLRHRVWIIVVTGTNFGNIDRQFCRLVRPSLRGHLVVCCNRGSEVYGFDTRGKLLQRWLRTATPEEERALTAIAESVRDEINARTGLQIGIVYDRLNRRKIDLIPLPEWADPPKAVIGELLRAVESRLGTGGLAGGIGAAIDLTQGYAREHGLPDARITSDVKHVEVGLTDKGDSMAWIKREVLDSERISWNQALIVGDEFGPIAGFAGSDDLLRQRADGATVASVGGEPNGAPPGVLRLGGGPARFRELLAEQGRLQQSEGARTHLPTPPSDPAWVLEEVGYEPGREHQIESRLAISNGYLGVRASLASPTRTSRPRTFVAGLFDASSTDPVVPALVPAPDWLGLRVYFADETGRRVRGDWLGYKRTLDLRHGLLYSEWRQQSREGHTLRIRTLRFVPLAERTLGVQVAEIEVEAPFAVSLEAWIEETWVGLKPGVTQGDVTIWRTPYTGSHLAVGSRAVLQRNGRALASEPRTNGGQGERWTWTSESGERVLFWRVVAMVQGEPPEALAERTQGMLPNARRTGVLRLLEAHNRAWEERWAASDVELGGDPEAQRALRFAIYHLISAANPDDDHVSIGARALTGDAYAGHVFWDTEIFLLPFYIFTWPAAARALLMYRHYTLPAAREKAHQLGYRGAFYAWESAGDGVEATPPYVFGPDGRAIVIQNAEQEIHISADVAYAVWQYWIATGDDDYFVSAGAEIIVETARFYASRAELDDDGRYHIPKVIGPDEYHEGVDDNAYTNFMAQWNLERALEVADLLASRWPHRWAEFHERLGVTPEEIRAWEDVASRLVTGIDPSSGLIEQFAGFFDLDPIYVSGYASRHAAMDVVLGMDRTRRSQVNKQADVVMLIALLWDRFSSQVREANFRYYEARCGHGSSLSPSMHGLVAAREGDVGLAQRYFEQAAAIDFDDSMGNAALGVHIAALGGLWQLAVLGFAGLILAEEGLRFDPHLPESWGSLGFPVQWRGRHLRVSITERGVCFAASLQEGEPMWIYLGDLQHKLKAGEPWTCRWDDMTRKWAVEP